MASGPEVCPGHPWTGSLTPGETSWLCSHGAPRIVWYMCPYKAHLCMVFTNFQRNFIDWESREQNKAKRRKKRKEKAVSAH